MTVDELDALPAGRARELLIACCGSSRWVTAMVGRRPFRSRAAVLTAADEIWRSLERADWLEAFAHHPRIGETKAAAGRNEQASTWSAGEQRAVTRASESIRLAQRDMNAQYERKFGYIYIVSATGKTPNEMVAIARDRLAHDPETEIAVAGEEQRKITRLRLEKLLEDRS